MTAGLRRTNIRKLHNAELAVCVVGAGINGAVSAAALAAQGVRVALIDKGDFGGATSSQSSNLAWGGIKYLESREFGLVAKLCKSRNHLAASYPSTVWEIRFLTTIKKSFRLPALLVFLGALFYWAIGRFKTRAPRYLSPAALKRREPLIEVSEASAGIEYSDRHLHDNDARFVFGFVRKAIDYGAVVASYVEATAATRDRDSWAITCGDTVGRDTINFSAKALINACGPEVNRFNELTGVKTEHSHALSKGIHLINIGDEIIELAKSLGADVDEKYRTWYGEPDDRTRDEFFHQARLMALDAMTDTRSSEPLPIRFWRRYGNEAFEMLERIREDPTTAERMIETAEYLRCEIEHTARREMTVKLDDFLPRRSKISLVIRQRDFLQSPGLLEACRVFFAEDAEAWLREYIDTTSHRRQS